MQQPTNLLEQFKTLDQITDIACATFQVDKDKLRAATSARGGNREYADIRKMIFAIAYSLSGFTLKSIGFYFGGRDHSTVINQIQKFNDLSTTDEAMKEKSILLLKNLGFKNGLPQHN